MKILFQGDSITDDYRNRTIFNCTQEIDEPLPKEKI